MDTEYVGDADDKKYTSRYMFVLQGTPISWFSRKQECRAISSTETKFVVGS